jgi:hypothetical protein
MILNVNLTGQESETLIKALLCDAIDSVGVSTDVECNHDLDTKPCLVSSDDGTVIEICDSSEDKIAGPRASISSIPLPKVRLNFHHQQSPLMTPAERFPPTWPISRSPQVGPVILCNGDFIPRENVLQRILNRFSSSTVYAWDQRHMNKYYRRHGMKSILE